MRFHDGAADEHHVSRCADDAQAEKTQANSFWFLNVRIDDWRLL
jgi:hypothetical protein